MPKSSLIARYRDFVYQIIGTRRARRRRASPLTQAAPRRRVPLDALTRIATGGETHREGTGDRRSHERRYGRSVGRSFRTTRRARIAALASGATGRAELGRLTPPSPRSQPRSSLRCGTRLGSKPSRASLRRSPRSFRCAASPRPRSAGADNRRPGGDQPEDSWKGSPIGETHQRFPHSVSMPMGMEACIRVLGGPMGRARRGPYGEGGYRAGWQRC
jgi:hypothetical protein